MILRVFISIIILIFSSQSLTKAEDISDFQIEGISVGESVLEHKNLNYIKKILQDKNTFYYKNKTFAVIDLGVSSELFEDISVTIKPNDNKYIIQAIEGRIFFPNDIENCKIKMNAISKDILSMFPKKNFKNIKNKHDYDKTGKSLYYANFMSLEKGSIELFCIDWSNQISKKDGFIDELKVGILDYKFRKWIDTEAF
jgi:hypothetical protein